MDKSRRNIIRLDYTLPVVLLIAQIIVFLVFFNLKPLTIFPFEGLEKKINFFTDSVDNGNSEIAESIVKRETILLKAKLGSQFKYPYCGLDLLFEEDFTDISAFNNVEIDFSTQGLSHLFLYLNVREEKVTNQKHRLALRRNHTDIHTNEGRLKTKIALTEFETPNWWFEILDLDKKSVGPPDWSKLKNIALTTGVNSPIGQEVKIELHSVRFYRDNTFVLTLMCCIQFAFVTFIFLRRFYLIRTQSKKEIEISYKAVDVKQPKDFKTNIVEYINSNFSNPDLSLKDVAKACGISPRNISDLIMEKTNLNFKTYVNQVRINESKRLLKETDLQINEIAYLVGFNSPSNFNRVFKTLENKSPSEYIKMFENQ